MLLCQRFFSISDDLVLKVVEGERVAHDELGLRDCRPLGLEGDREVADTVPLDWEGSGVVAVDDEVVSILGRIRHPGYLDVPVAFGVVDDGQVLGDLAPGGHVHLEDGLERLGLDGEDHSVPAHVGLGLVGDQHISGELVDRVLADDGKGDFVLQRNDLGLALDGVALLGLVLALLGLFVGRLVRDEDALLGADVGVGSDFDQVVFGDVVLDAGLVGLLGGGGGVDALLALLEALDGLLGARYHVVLGVDLVLPVDDLIDTESHGGPDFCSDSGRFYGGDDLMLELAHHVVDEEDGGLGGEHAHGDVVERESARAVLADLDVLRLAVDGLDLLVLRQGSDRVLALQVLVLEDVLGLVADREVHQLGRVELVCHLDRKLDLFVEQPGHVPDPIADSACYLRLELEDQSRCGQALLFDVDEHNPALDWRAEPRHEPHLKLVGLLGLDAELLSADQFEVLAALVLDRIADWLAGRVAEFYGAGDFLSEDALEDDGFLFGRVEGQVDVEMEDEEEHFPLQRVVDVLGADVVLQSDLGQVLAESVRVLLVVLLAGAHHLHPLQHHHVRVLLDQRTDHRAVPEVLVEVAQPPLLQQHLGHRLLAPKEEDVLGVGAEVRVGEVVGGYLGQGGQVLLEVLGRDPRQHVDLEDLVEQRYPGLHGEVVVEPGVDLQEGRHVELRFFWGQVAEVHVEVGEGEQVLRPDVVEVRPLDLQHLDELVVLLEDLAHLLQSLLIAAQPPRVTGALVADEAQDFEQRRAVVLDEGAGEVGDGDGEEVGVEVAVDVVDGVGEDGGRDGRDAQVGEDGLVGDVGLERVRGVLALQRGRGRLYLRGLDELEGVVGLDGEAVLVTQEVGVVGEDAVVRSAGDRDAEGAVHVVSELQFQAEAHGLVELPGEVDADLLLGDADVEALREGELDADVGDVVDELALQVAVLIAVVEHPKRRGGLDLQRHHRHDHLPLVEVQHGQARGALEDDVHVLERLFDLAGGDEQRQLVVVLAHCVGVEADLEL